jgi:hypothetical protein
MYNNSELHTVILNFTLANRLFVTNIFLEMQALGNGTNDEQEY